MPKTHWLIVVCLTFSQSTAVLAEPQKHRVNTAFNFELPVTQTKLLREDVEILTHAIATTKDSNSLTRQLAEKFSGVGLIVSRPLESNSIAVSQNPILPYLDKRIPDKTRNFFLRYFEGAYAGGMFFGEIGTTFSNPDGKLILEQPLLILPSNAPRTTVIHEFLHYLIFRARLAGENTSPLIYTADEIVMSRFANKWAFTSDELNGFDHLIKRISSQLGGEDAEHLDLHVILLRNADLFGLTEQENLENRERLELYFKKLSGLLSFLDNERDLIYALEIDRTYSEKTLNAIRSELLAQRPQVLKVKEEFDLKQNLL